MSRAARALALAILAAMHAGPARAQGYRLRVDTRWQTAAYRGVVADSIPVTDTVMRPGSGPTSRDGFAVLCRPGAPYCSFFRPGPTRRGGPVTTTADATIWGLGVPGMSVRAAARIGFDVGSADGWPGTEPAVQLLEGYAEYARTRATARLGRQVVASRLGVTGFDGAAVVVRDRRRGVDVQAYVGRGLVRGAALPVTSPALNPLDDFQPRSRQTVAGVGGGWTTRHLDVRAEYQREVDPRSDYFVSEHLGMDAVVRPVRGVRLAGGADYDLAAGWWGSAEASVAYATRAVQLTLGGRRYRPHFDLWTIWGAFSPVPYRAVHATVALAAGAAFEVRGRYERYEFDGADAATPLFDAQRDGWRWEIGATATPTPAWSLDGAYRREFGPGAATVGLAGSVSYQPSQRLRASLLGSTVDRPLEFRFNDAAVRAYALDAQIAASDRVRVGLMAHWYDERHRRPDAGAFDWEQLRLSARVVVLFTRGADMQDLPPAIRVLPGGRSPR